MLTAAEVGELVGVQPRTVVHWARSGRLSALRAVYGQWRFSHAAVIRLLVGDHGPEHQAVVLPFSPERRMTPSGPPGHPAHPLPHPSWEAGTAEPRDGVAPPR
jgi:excisionase family DNA binding protein